jgi:hypothetical protein
VIAREGACLQVQPRMIEEKKKIIKLLNPAI